MKVLLNGYLCVQNFGDMLFAHLFYEKCKSLNYETDFLTYKKYGISPECARELNYTPKKDIKSCLEADAYVLISGGSLGDNTPDPKFSKIRCHRFVYPTQKFQKKHKPVYILGVGGGPIFDNKLRKRIVRMLNKAELIHFREPETKEYYEKYGVKSEKMIVTSDTAQVIVPEMLPPFKDEKKVSEFSKGRKKLLLHIPDGTPNVEVLINTILPGVLKFTEEHTEYCIILSLDSVRTLSPYEEKVVASLFEKLNILNIEYYFYKYYNAWQYCGLLNSVDLIITEKLHTGVVGASLGKSVVSFPVHISKTQRYYKQIGEADRCIHSKEITTEIVISQLNKFHDKPIVLSQEIRDLAKKNLDALEHLSDKA